MKIAIALGLVFVLLGCALAPKDDAVLEMGQGAYFRIPASSYTDASFQVRQVLTVIMEKQTFLLEAYILVGPSIVTLVSTDSTGRRAITVEWRGREVISEKADWLPPEISATMLISHLALIYWPEHAVREALVGENLSLVETSTSRRIGQGGKDLLKIVYGTAGDSRWQGSAKFTHIEHHYEIVIQSELLP